MLMQGTPFAVQRGRWLTDRPSLEGLCAPRLFERRAHHHRTPNVSPSAQAPAYSCYRPLGVILAPNLFVQVNSR